METLHLPLTDVVPSGDHAGYRRASCSCGWFSPWYPPDKRGVVDLEGAYHQSAATGRPMPRRVNGAMVAVVWVVIVVGVLVLIAFGVLLAITVPS